MSVTQPILCPKCGRADAVRKVSAIVSQGTWSSETAGIGLGLGDRSLNLMSFVGTSTSRSALATMFVPPAKPAKPQSYGWAAAFTVGRLALVLFVGLLLAGATLFSLPLLMNTYSANRMLLLAPLAAVALFIVTALVWIVRSAIRDVRATHSDRDSYENRFQTWQHAAEQWKNLYYCARDDGVFMLDERILIPVSRTKEFTNSDGNKKELRV